MNEHQPNAVAAVYDRRNINQRKAPAVIDRRYRLSVVAAFTLALVGTVPAESFSDAASQVNELTAPKLKMKDHDGHRGLAASFSLLNSLIEYGVVYRVCNDVEAHEEKDLRRAWGQFLPGIGFKKPNLASWYYNNYIKILLDGIPVGDYVIKDIRQEDYEGNAKVVVTWETPKAMVDLAFVLMRDHTGVFQELKVYDLKEPIDHIAVSLSGYAWGLTPEDNVSDAFVTEDPAYQAWALMGNKVRQPPEGIGPCALLTLPEELDLVKFGRPITMEKTVGLKPGQSASLRWVLWMFPEMSNDAALEYMDKNAAETKERLKKLFPGAN